MSSFFQIYSIKATIKKSGQLLNILWPTGDCRPFNIYKKRYISHIVQTFNVQLGLYNKGSIDENKKAGQSTFLRFIYILSLHYI